tara:strand:+ start:215 stop:517 length:303 start_codon:yes stop_codon:yes gene_type:complete
MDIKKNIEVKAGKSKWYYEYDRNLDNSYNQKKDDRIPEYYKGKNGYEARKVCDNFDLSYHLGTAVTYILRSYHKHKTPVECLTKAIAHLQFEIEKYNEEK